MADEAWSITVPGKWVVLAAVVGLGAASGGGAVSYMREVPANLNENDRAVLRTLNASVQDLGREVPLLRKTLEGLEVDAKEAERRYDRLEERVRTLERFHPIP